MRFIRFASCVTASAAGLAYGFLYHAPFKHRHLISAASPVSLDVDTVIAKGIESYATTYAPIMKHGFPSYDSVRIRGNFVLSYDRRNRVSNWVMEHLTSDKIEAEACGSRRRSRFHEDETIHDYFRATLSDYRNSGYDRGHLAATGNHRHYQRDLDETFVLSNITPQNAFFNQGIWHSLEKHALDLAKEYGSVYVCSGPLYLPRVITAEEEKVFLEEEQEDHRNNRSQIPDEYKHTKKYVLYEVIGDNNVAVPTHFFKVILCEVKEDLYDMEAYIIPNERVDPNLTLEHFMVPKNAIERAAGFLLFHQLPPSSIRKINGDCNDATQDILI